MNPISSQNIQDSHLLPYLTNHQIHIKIAMKKTTQLLLLATLVSGLILVNHVPEAEIHIPDVESPRQLSDYKERLRKAQEELDALSQSCKKRETTLENASRQRISGIISGHRARVSACAKESASHFQGFSNVSLTIYLGAKDFAFHTEELNNYVVENTRSCTQLLSGALGEVQVELDAYHSAVLALIHEFERDSLRIADNLEIEPADLSLPDFQGLAAAIQSSVSSNRNAAISGGFELAWIGATWRCIQAVISKLAQRQATTMASAGTLVVADGALPIGDVIAAVVAVGGAASTAWDMRAAIKTLKELPGQMEKELLAQLDQIDREASAFINSLSSTSRYDIPPIGTLP